MSDHGLALLRVQLVQIQHRAAEDASGSRRVKRTALRTAM
jgi:hypothetical protein